MRISLLATWDSLDRYIELWSTLEADKDGEVAVDDVKAMVTEEGYPQKIVDVRMCRTKWL